MLHTCIGTLLACNILYKPVNNLHVNERRHFFCAENEKYLFFKKQEDTNVL